jgi:hypothetical protein
MANYIFLIVLLLFLAKLILNIAIPFLLETAYRKWLAGEGDKPASVSMALLIEVFFLLILVLMSLIFDGYPWSSKSVIVFGFGILLICISYALCAVFGKILRCVR